jgi:organic radical activating enzyme
MDQKNLTTAKINDVFWTFQGEGEQAGRRALFVRMPFCDLKCEWCDTEFNTFKTWREDQFKDFAASEPGRFAVVTGGEPMMNKQTPRVLDWLKDLGFEIACESNGRWPILDRIDFPTVSPKRQGGYTIHPRVWDRVKEFKYVIDEGFDWRVLDRHNERDDGVRLSLSPEFGRFTKSLEEIFEYIRKNPRWRISLQTHKWMEIA